MDGQIIFHGGCRGCTMQTKEGLGYCVGCKYFDFANTSHLPDLNDSHKDKEAELNKFRGEARAQAVGLNPVPKGEKLTKQEQLDIAVEDENYEEAARLRDLIEEDAPYQKALSEAIAAGDYAKAADIREQKKKGFFGKLGDWFKK